MDLRRRPVLGAAAVALAAAVLTGLLLLCGERLETWAMLAGLLAFASCQLPAVQGAHGFRGADAVTLLRTLLLGVFAAAAMQTAAGGAAPTGEGLSLPLVSLGAVILAMDGLDGAVARSGAGGTPAGARYDETADAVVLSVLALAAALSVGWWAVLLGLLRPAFALGGRLRPAWRRPLPPSRRRKALGVTSGILLLVALAPWPAGMLPEPGLEHGLRGLPVAVALALVASSFAVDIRQLERTQPESAQPGEGRVSGEDG